MKGKSGAAKTGLSGKDEKSKEVDEDFLEVCHDDSKFGGKSISSPIKSIEVRNQIFQAYFSIKPLSLPPLIG